MDTVQKMQQEGWHITITPCEDGDGEADVGVRSVLRVKEREDPLYTLAVVEYILFFLGQPLNFLAAEYRLDAPDVVPGPAPAPALG